MRASNTLLSAFGLYLLLFVAIYGCDDRQAETKSDGSVASVPRTVPATEAEPEPAVNVFKYPALTLKAGPPRDIFIAYDDGRILWSEDRVHGAAKLNERRLSAERITALRARLTETAQRSSDARRVWGDVHAGLVFIRFRATDGTLIEYASVHELAEATGAVVTERGLVRPGETDQLGRSRDTADYGPFLKTWRALREATEEAIRDATEVEKNTGGESGTGKTRGKRERSSRHARLDVPRGER